APARHVSACSRPTRRRTRPPSICRDHIPLGGCGPSRSGEQTKSYPCVRGHRRVLEMRHARVRDRWIRSMVMRLQGKIAFCTASGAGIGRATAIAFAREGARVIATDIDGSKLKGLEEEGVAECLELDVRDTASIEALAKRFSPVDILFNAAGDRKSTRLNSSHVKISYAVFCLKKKKKSKQDRKRTDACDAQ